MKEIALSPPCESLTHTFLRLALPNWLKLFHWRLVTWDYLREYAKVWNSALRLINRGYGKMTRPVTVPFPFKERELFEHFTFFWAGTVEQFFSFELEQLTSSFLLNWNSWPVHFFWAGTGQQFFDSVHTNCWTWTVTCLKMTNHRDLVAR